ncbi:MAG: four helix bundle protein [Rickettsiales bacterium]|nr:four helix bundle protein [Rickettsiales bacterium]
MERISSYKDLVVWQKATQLALFVYKATKSFPKEEMYGLTSQIRRCSVSVPSNIAEGSERNSTRDFLRFINMAHGSLAELETQFYIAQQLEYVSAENYEQLQTKAAEIGRMLNGLAKKLEEKLATGHRSLATT